MTIIEKSYSFSQMASIIE